MQRLASLSAWLAAAISSAAAAEPPLLSFDSLEGLQCRPSYKCVEAKVELDTDHRREGKAAAKLTWKAADDDYGVVHLVASVPQTDLRGKSFNIAVMPFDGNSAIWGVEFYDADGKKVEEHRSFHVPPGRWSVLRFEQGRKAKYGWMRKGEGDPKRVTRLIFRAQTRAGGQTAAALLDDFRLFRLPVPGQQVVTERIRRAPVPERTPPTLARGETAIWLDPRRGYAFAGARLGGLLLEPSVGKVYPTFKFLDHSGALRTLDATDRRWKVEGRAQGKDKLVVAYSCRDTTIELLWTAEPEAIECEGSVLSEGELLAAEVGSERIFGVVLADDDYGIPPNGFLPRYTREPIKVEGAPKMRTPLFVAARVGKTILLYKPLTASQAMGLCLRKAGDERLAWMGGTLFFRPRGFKNPKTRLCHTRLGWRAETAGEENNDGAVDWVDCAIAYRERYVKPNPRKSQKLRDSYRYYHPLYITPSYDCLLKLVRTLGFATGVWWMKGMMRTNQRPVSEAHPYTVERYARAGDLSKVKPAILAAGALIGPYYGHDYIDYLGGDWPASLVKLDPDGQPHRYYKLYGHQLYYKDNVRGMATDQLTKHYARILAACWLEPGDTIMLDTFTAYARPGYSPEYPATVQKELEAKRELARWLKEEKGLVVAAEGIIDGTQDVVDYGAVSAHVREFAEKRPWRLGWVPLKAVVFNGSSYFGCSWYSVRHPHVNYAAMLAECLGMWEWSTIIQNDPDQMFMKTARDHFLEQVFWSRIADHKITDVDKQGTAYTFKFENGSVLWVDPESEKYWLEEGGIRYDGFTPFNSNGVMAIIKPGKLDIVLPVTEMLEAIPSQPDRDKLAVEITREPDGRVRVRGEPTGHPFRLMRYDGKSASARVAVPPVLMLRKVAQPARRRR